WGYLDRHYDLEHVAAMFIAIDGAGWIRKGCEYMPKSVFVLDRYHVHKQLSEALGGDPERRQAVWRALDSLNAHEVQRLLREAYQQADSHHRRQAIRRTATYLRRNWDGIRAWRRWEGIWHGCSAEGHVSHVYAARLSSRPMAWSRAGVHTMARLRVLQANGGSASAAYLHGKARPPLQVSSRWLQQVREEVETGRLLPAETLNNLPALRGPRSALTRGPRPGKWCQLGSSALSAIYTPGPASNSRVSFNPFRAYGFFIDSWLKYRLGAAVHSSCCSMRTAPAKRISEARFGKIPTTSVRRPISRINRSNGFVECNCRQCSWGKAMYGRMSSSASFSIWAALGKRCAKLCTTLASCPWAAVLSGWAKTVRTRAATICCADFGTCDSRLRMKCTRQRC